MHDATIRKYDQIRAFLLAESLKPESRQKMPTVQELMRKFGASQSPVCRAIRDLEKAGVVRCRRGAGMVSCSPELREETIPQKLPGSSSAVLFLRTDYFSESLWSMEHTLLSYARQLNVPVISSRIDQNSDIIAMISSLISSREIAGIIMNSSPGTKSDELIEYLNQLSIPVVMIASSSLYENIAPNVTILSFDSAQGGHLCIETLVRAGHSRIGYIRNEPESDMTRLRLAGMTAAAEEYGVSLTCFSSTVRAWENSATAAEKITRARLDEIRSLNLTALIYFSGSGALAGRRVLQLAGVRIPDDISILCEDDSSIMEIVYPAQSVIVCRNYLDDCREALDIITGRTPSPGIRLGRYEYIPRETIRSLI